MKDARASLRYAKAILNLAIDKKTESEVNNDMLVIASTIEQSDDLKALLVNPVIKSSDKVKALNELFKDTCDLTKGVFTLLQDNKRLAVLDLVAQKYTILFNSYKDASIAYVTTAVPLTKELEQKIQAKIISLVGNEVAIENIVDESILGGVVIKVGDRQFDASLANKFSRLKRTFEDNHYQAKI